MSKSWLQKKRKGELLELAQRANVPDADTLLKDDLVAALEDTLLENESIFGKQADFSEYYGRSGSPIKRERFSPEVLASGRPRRRQTLVKRDSDDITPDRSTALVSRTPRSVTSLARRVSSVGGDLPASPSQLADVADQSFQVVKERATELWDRSQIDEWKEYIRENASSVAAVQTLILLIEAVGLQYNTLETFHAFDSLSNAGLSLHSHEVHLPNLWRLAEAGWWAPATLWSLTSWVLPLVVSYFFNLTLRTNTRHKSSNRQSTVDPLTFNIVKAILVYSARSTVLSAVVSGQKTHWGPFAADTVSKVQDNVPGQYYGLQIGAIVGVLVSLYDAALKK
ncbi:hypothetical protein CC80DRAFT_550392 [Byssothecium circinans]|uniref:Uncharacterized protein n=1 Tax=Byssothecium circinans TaxID=147558 RepID=A0A6A5TUK2_9PLEO|nr:hypothetical protein CC80DRAFT_550392 [Byssothecium circinans]